MISPFKYSFRLGIPVFLLLFIFSSLKAQTLRIVQVQFPDSVLLGSTVTAGFTIVNEDTASQLGDMRIWFGNPDIDGHFAPLGYFSSKQFFAAGQQREFNISIPIRPDLFKGGGNTVVIWPSFIDHPDVAVDSTFLDIFVINPNSSTSIASVNSWLKIKHLPETDLLEVTTPGTLSEPETLILYEGSGRMLKKGEGTSLALPGLGHGIYILEIHFKNGLLSRQKIYWSAR